MFKKNRRIKNFVETTLRASTKFLLMRENVLSFVKYRLFATATVAEESSAVFAYAAEYKQRHRQTVTTVKETGKTTAFGKTDNKKYN